LSAVNQPVRSKRKEQKQYQASITAIQKIIYQDPAASGEQDLYIDYGDQPLNSDLAVFRAARPGAILRPGGPVFA